MARFLALEKTPQASLVVRKHGWSFSTVWRIGIAIRYPARPDDGGL
jgi:hypothetical protein